jgi:hypothetical protein
MSGPPFVADVPIQICAWIEPPPALTVTVLPFWNVGHVPVTAGIMVGVEPPAAVLPPPEPLDELAAAPLLDDAFPVEPVPASAAVPELLLPELPLVPELPNPPNPANPLDPPNPANPLDPPNPANPLEPPNPANPLDPPNPANPLEPPLPPKMPPRPLELPAPLLLLPPLDEAGQLADVQL